MEECGIEVPFNGEEEKAQNHIDFDFKSNEQIPVAKLGQDNPILNFGDIPLYEDEFGDRGYSKVNVRYRVMGNCFFVLLRSYVRVDQVLVRIMDTRVFHEFGESYLLRDFSLREATYDELRAGGFGFGS
jgi:type 2A phosphatase activator TIP41